MCSGSSFQGRRAPAAIGWPPRLNSLSVTPGALAWNRRCGARIWLTPLLLPIHNEPSWSSKSADSEMSSHSSPCDWFRRDQWRPS
ncbi:hypothetical protein ATB53_13715 [Xanthomonas translucens]|uniref:Uncharacterized protein n=1 Tax=Xanthomonas campestris pv. translucens TaxID=343 RepID=A0A109HM53_XANCT|nr:hypothetical protein ATB53_13715 [Xanthomonas translucens]KWV14635.1 hypothetical protein ATB54_11680 [Xanthomonas translucens]CCP38869.1 hypothetical protein BN444_00588 [Xanthomonas translucens pv. translucens DSM 18974]